MENPVLPSSCVTPAGTSIEVQNEREENTTHTHMQALIRASSANNREERLQPTTVASSSILLARSKVPERRAATLLLLTACSRLLVYTIKFIMMYNSNNRIEKVEVLGACPHAAIRY